MPECEALLNATRAANESHQNWNAPICSWLMKLFFGPPPTVSCGGGPPPRLQNVSVLPSVGDSYFDPDGADPQCIHSLVDGRFISFYIQFVQGGEVFLMVMLLLCICHVWHVDGAHLLDTVDKLGRIARLPRGRELLDEYSSEVSAGLPHVIGSTSEWLFKDQSWKFAVSRYVGLAVLWVLANQPDRSFDYEMMLTSVLSAVLLNAAVSLTSGILWAGVRVTYFSNYVRSVS